MCVCVFYWKVCTQDLKNINEENEFPGCCWVMTIFLSKKGVWGGEGGPYHITKFLFLVLANTGVFIVLLVIVLIY